MALLATSVSIALSAAALGIVSTHATPILLSSVKLASRMPCRAAPTATIAPTCRRLESEAGGISVR
eukprot:3130740-Pleurochrysis_carterae.AAC.1